MNCVMTLMNDLIEEISMGPFGSDIKVDSFVDSGVPVLNGANVSGVKLIENSFNYVSEEKAKSLKKANAKRGDIVVTHRGTLGQISYIPNDSLFENYVISQSQFRVRLKRALVDPRYFTYYFHTEEGQRRLLSFKNHVGVPALAQATTNFRLLEFPLIPLEEQIRIADFLTALDSKISINNRINAELEAMAKTIYDYWFVQFDFPDKNLKPYKASGGKMVWSEVLKREIPEGWKVKQLGSILRHNYQSLGKSLDMKLINYLDTSSLTRNYIENLQQIDLIHNVLPSRAQRIVSRNDILYSTVRPNQAHYGIIKEPIENLIASTGFAQLSSKEKEISNDLVYTFLSSDWVMNRLQQIADSSVSAYPSISPNDILGLYIALPNNNSLLNQMNDQLGSIYMMVSVNYRQNQKLTELRDWLLPMLMNGQVKIRETTQSKVAKPVMPQIRPANPYFYQTQLVAAIVNASKKNKISHGEMTLAKYTYLVDRLYSVPTYFDYERWHLGPYPKEMKKVVNNKKFFKIQNNEVSVVPQKKEYNYEFKQQVEDAISDLASVFNQYKGKKRSHKTELLATVCKVVEDIQSTDLKKVRESMKKWPIELKGGKFKNKAEKFDEDETKSILNFILLKGWDKQLGCSGEQALTMAAEPEVSYRKTK